MYPTICINNIHPRINHIYILYYFDLLKRYFSNDSQFVSHVQVVPHQKLAQQHVLSAILVIIRASLEVQFVSHVQVEPNIGSSQCFPCGPGNYYDAGSVSCSPCGIGCIYIPSFLLFGIFLFINLMKVSYPSV